MRVKRVVVAAGAAALSIAALGAGTVQAAPTFRCDASALRGTVQGTSVEPSVAGRGTATCATSQSGLSLPLPAPLTASTLSAATVFDPANGIAQSTGGVGDLGFAVPDGGLGAAFKNADLAIDKALAGRSLSLPGLGDLTAPIRDALRAQARQQAAAEPLLSVRVASARASASCRDGSPALAGSSEIAGIRLLGTDLPVDGVVQQAVRVFGGGSIDPSALDPAALGVPAELSGPLKGLLDGIPTIKIPDALAQVKIVPGEQVRDGDSLTQRALRITAVLAGQSLLDLVVGEARVAVEGACPGAAVADEILRCTDRKLVLVDVLERRGRVRLLGAANRDYVGRRVNIRLRATNKIVARPTVRRDGSFAATAKVPPNRFRYTNRARYRAEIRREKSLPLKLHRRMIVDRMTARNGKVTIAGRVIRPLASPVRKITLKRRISCREMVVVKRFSPRSDGSFRVTVKAPKGTTAAVYRMQTRVRKHYSNPKTYPTFTLPRGVNLNKR